MILQFDLREEASFDNYYFDQNKALYAALYAMGAGQGERFVYLWGQKGAGKTHLLQAACHVARSLDLSFFYLSLQNIKKLDVSVFEGLDALSLVCLDDIDALVDKPKWEEALFNLFNQMQEMRHRLIVSAPVAPSQLGLKLKDLESRLLSGMAFQMEELDEETKLKALTARAKARGLDLPSDVAAFIFRRYPRDLGTLFGVLDKLDQASLVAKRKLTVPFVKEVLGV